MNGRLRLGAAGALVVLAAAAPLTAHADKPSAACPSEKWSESVFPLDWQPGDPMDPTGDNLLLQIGLAGLVEEFGTVEAGLEAFGFATIEELYAAVVDPELNEVDKNDDGILCVKRFPTQGNQPAYLANAVDNTAASG